MEYETIKLWGKHAGSFKYYIDAQIAKARADKAPANAIYKKDDGTWATADDIADIHNRPEMADFIPYLTGKETK